MSTPRSQKKYGGWTWTLMMFSMNTCIPMFILGPIGQGLGLNFWQALWGSLVGNLAAVAVMWLNGVVGAKHGITYPVQLRSTFGFRGTHIPVIMRGLSGLVWFGVEAWAGSLAITMIIYLAVALTGTILPQDIIVKFSPGVVPALIGLLFAFLAPWSTDKTANSIPLFNILMSTFKLRWKPAVIIGSVVAFFAVPCGRSRPDSSTSTTFRAGPATTALSWDRLRAS